MTSNMSTEDYITIDMEKGLTQNPSPPEKEHHTKTSSDHVVINMEEGLVQAPGPEEKKTKTWNKSTIVTMVILLLLQLQDNIDTLVVMASLNNIKITFNITTTQAETSSIVFIAFLGVLVPLFGTICDCCKKTRIIRFGIMFQIIVSLLTSFMQGENDPTLNLIYFMISRVFSSASHASYSTIPNSIIGELFDGHQRTWMLALYQIAGLIGNGLAYIIHTETLKAMAGDWRWGLRLSAAFSLVTVFLVNYMKIPSMEKTEEPGSKRATFKSCFCAFLGLWKNWSLMFSVLGLTALRCVEQATTLWMPKFFMRAREKLYQDQECQSLLCDLDDEDIFGTLTIASAIIGVFTGVILCHKLRKIDPDADPIVCAWSLTASVPILYLCFNYADVNLVASYILLFIALMLLNMASIITSSMTLYVVSPSTWCCAEALELLFSHLLGTLPGTFIIEVEQDLFHKTWPHLEKYHCLKYSLMICGLITTVGGICYMITAFVIEKDRKKYETTS